MKKRRAWLWLGAAMICALCAAALLVPEPPDPAVVAVQALVQRHGLVPFEDPDGGGSYVAQGHKFADQKRLIADYDATMAALGLYRIYEDAQNAAFLRSKLQPAVRPRFAVIDQRWAPSQTLIVRLTCEGSKSVVKVERHRSTVGQRAAAWLRRLTGRP